MAPWQHVVATVLLLIGSTFGLALPGDPELQENFIEGDMALSPSQSYALENPLSRNGLLDTNYRWPQGIVKYRISPDFSAAQKAAILDAMKAISNCSCISFREATEMSEWYVYITNYNSGCYSYVGYQRRVQELNLAPYPIGYGCFRIGTIIHELLHALGLFHQQSASDRDDYVDILLENVVSGAERNFQKYSANYVSNYGVPYDYNSVLHYPKWAFSKNGLDTIVPKDKTAEIGQRVGLSKGDIEKINRMYNC